MAGVMIVLKRAQLTPQILLPVLLPNIRDIGTATIPKSTEFRMKKGYTKIHL
jgi:hypothetical protein